MVADQLGDDVARAGQRVVRRGHVVGKEGRGQRVQPGDGAGLGQDLLGQRLQAAFARDHGAGAALGLVGLVEVFQYGARLGGHDLGAQTVGEFALFFDGGEDGGPAFVQGPCALQFTADGADLFFVQPAGGLFAVAGDEGQGVAVVEQRDDSRDAVWRKAEFLRDGVGVLFRHRIRW